MPQEIEVQSTTPLPKGYTFLPKGNRYKTLHTRKYTHEACQPLYIVFSAKTQIGLRAPTATVQRVDTQAASTLSTRTVAIQRRDALDLSKASTQLNLLFPCMPEQDKERVLGHSFRKSSGRVGRTGRLDLRRKVELAVGAHVRHQHTGYDQLLSDGVEREEARRREGKVMERIMKEWGWQKGNEGMRKKGRKGRSKKKV